MQLVKNNPYRLIGLLVGASAREQTRQVKRLKQFIEAEQAPQQSASFPALGNLEHTLESVNDAAAKLNLDNDKMNAALFWFYNGYSITDDPAFETLNDGDIQATKDIWAKLTNGSEVSERNASAFQNLSTLLLAEAFDGSMVYHQTLKEAVGLKLKFLESDFARAFKDLATDETYKANGKELQVLFLTQLQSAIDKQEGISSGDFLNILSQQEFIAKDDFMKGFVQKPIEQIEKKVTETKNKRKADKADALAAGNELYEQTSEDLSQLKSILGETDLTFSNISDKVSGELLQCGIDYFAHYRETENDPGLETKELFDKAKSLAIGNIANQRYEENAENLQEWIDNAPSRERQKVVMEDIEILGSLIEECESTNHTVLNARSILNRARPHLEKIKEALGPYDEFYLGLSTRIAAEVQVMCVTDINDYQERINTAYTNDAKRRVIDGLKDRVYTAWDLMIRIGKMDYVEEFAESYQNNYSSLSDLKYQLSQVNTQGDGCYIATMAYGDYDHPQVMVLRQFRDEVLAKSVFGRWFIRTYYRYSPLLVEKLKHKPKVNRFIRTSLNRFIKLIKK